MVRSILTRFGGKEIDTAGDGFPITFDGPARAIRAAASVRAGLDEEDIRIRVGLHTGECELVDGKVRGIAVHVAARVMAQAEGNEILCSRTVKDLVADPASCSPIGASTCSRACRTTGSCTRWSSPSVPSPAPRRQRRRSDRGPHAAPAATRNAAEKLPVRSAIHLAQLGPTSCAAPNTRVTAPKAAANRRGSSESARWAASTAGAPDIARPKHHGREHRPGLGPDRHEQDRRRHAHVGPRHRGLPSHAVRPTAEHHPTGRDAHTGQREHPEACPVPKPESSS